MPIKKSIARPAKKTVKKTGAKTVAKTGAKSVATAVESPAKKAPGALVARRTAPLVVAIATPDAAAFAAFVKKTAVKKSAAKKAAKKGAVRKSGRSRVAANAMSDDDRTGPAPAGGTSLVIV